MDQKAITQEEKTQKEIRAEEQFKRAQAHLAKVRREKKEQIRKAENRHKYMIGGVVHKYFPECYDFSEEEMNRIIACAFSLGDVKNMIRTVVNERSSSKMDNDTTADKSFKP